MALPRFFVVGARPVKLVATAEGGMAVLALDWQSGEFVRELGYLSRCLGDSPEVDEVSEEEFEARVSEVRATLWT